MPLEIRPCCEHCGKDLPYDSEEAMICTFECTYCKDCAIGLFENVCPNCTGGFVQRPVRPKQHHAKYPIGTARLHEPKDLDKMKVLIDQYGAIAPKDR
ncbi:DUF1272 domain-containing protein [Chitinophagales bacterium]|nr:DUF1272 domain-containing protein [Chitinophagales bacterium]